MGLTQEPQNTDTSAPSSPPKQNDYPWLQVYPDNINWSMDLSPRPLYEFLDDSANRIGSNTCTYFLGKTQTYKDIQTSVNHVAKGLQSKGIGKGSKIGLLLPNTPTFIIFYYAILKTGATVVNYNPLYTVEELSEQVKDSETDAIVTLDLKLLFDKAEALMAEGTLSKTIVCSFADLLPGLKSILFRLFKSKDLTKPQNSKQSANIIYEKDLIENDGKVIPPDINIHEDIALLQYTGGTTGIPKGAMLTHANLSCNVQQIIAWAPDMVFGKEIIYGVLPLFHVFAMASVMNYGLAIGAEMILIPKFEINEGLKLLDDKKPTIMPGVPTLYTAMINHPKLDKYDLSSIKFCISGGAALPVEIKKAFEKRSGCNMVEGYGLSETSPVATCNLAEGPVRDGSIGVPIPRTILSIRSLEDSNIEMPIGEKGEICISGPQVMKGYWQNEEATTKVFTGEFFHSGDVGYMDEQGFIYIVDRLKDLIICSGFNVYPRRIEEAIYQFPAVEEVTVIGIPDEYRGESPKAFIKLKKDHSATKEEIFEFLKVKISKLEMPSQIEFRDELPKTMIGKLSKKELREEHD